MPWDSTDKYRDEDFGERRKKSRRRYRRGGKRTTDISLSSNGKTTDSKPVNESSILSSGARE